MKYGKSIGETRAAVIPAAAPSPGPSPQIGSGKTGTDLEEGGR